jgi:hypothetical protein
MAVKEYHVETDGKGKWHIRRGDQDKPFAFYNSMEAAESACRALAHLQEAQVVVHEKGGAVRKTDYRGEPV